MSVSPGDVVRAACPRCGKGRISDGLFRMKRECPECGLNLFPEPGYYLGAMMAAFLVTAMIMIPVILLLKVNGAEPLMLILVPIGLYVVLCPLITHYARILWIHLEYRVSDRWEKDRRG